MNDERQVIENLKTAETALPNTMISDEFGLIAHAADAYRRLFKVSCTGCQYCLPCTNGVNTPRNFQVSNGFYSK